MSFAYPLIYTGNADLLDAIRGPMEAYYFEVMRPETPEASKALMGGEYAAITYYGGETATIAVYPDVAPRQVPIAIAPNGHIDANLTRAVFMAHFDAEGADAVTEAEQAALRLREAGPTDPA